MSDENNKLITIDAVKARNTQAFDQALKETNAKVFSMMDIISTQQQAIGSLLMRMDQLEQKINIQKVQLMGLGPSVKS